MKKQLGIYFGVLTIFIITPIAILLIWIFSLINTSKSAVTEQDFINKAKSLNAQVSIAKLNVKTSTSKYASDEINNLIHKIVEKSLSAKSDNLDLIFIKCINNKVAYNFYLEEYNDKITKKLQTAQELGNKQTSSTSFNGKNFNYRETYTNYGNYAFIRVEDVYLGITSFDDDIFKNAIETFDFKNPLNFTADQIIAIAIGFNLFVFFMVLIYFQIPLAYLFKKANIHPAIAFVPICNRYFLCKMADDEGWKMIFFYIPIVSVVYQVMISLKLAKVFNKSELFGVGIFFIPVIFMPIVAFDDSQYNKTNSEKLAQKKNIYEEILNEYE